MAATVPLGAPHNSLITFSPAISLGIEGDVVSCLWRALLRGILLVICDGIVLESCGGGHSSLSSIFLFSFYSLKKRKGRRRGIWGRQWRREIPANIKGKYPWARQFNRSPPNSVGILIKRKFLLS
jgi:hypothetical protein